MLQRSSRTQRVLAVLGEHLLRPLADDEERARFWVRHVKVGVAITEVTAVIVLAYVVAADRPGRTLFLVIAGLVMLASPLLLALPIERLSAGHSGPLVFYLWSIAVTVVIVVLALIDGGADSPLVWLFVLTLTFAALAYPPLGVMLMGGVMVSSYLVVAAADAAVDSRSLLVAAVLLTFTVMTAWVSRNHADTYRQQRLLATRLAQLDHAREEFVATTSHELRTPVTSILGYVELLEDLLGQRQPEAAAFLLPVRRNAERLRTLSEELLVLSRWGGALDRSVPVDQLDEEVDLGQVLGRVEATMVPLATAQAVALEVAVPALTVLVRGSGDHLEQAVLNLVSNAVKYTPSGGRVSCSLRHEERSAVVEVRDTGIGIAPEDIERLFTRFFRADSARARSIAGVGLGLSIVRAIVDTHGGTVAVSSRLEEGTSFVVRLPALAPAIA